MENSLDLIVKDGLALAEKTEKELTSLLDRTNVFNKITTRAANEIKPKFYVFDEDKLDVIAERMSEVNRAVRSLGRKNTQVTNRLMTLTMLNGISPMRMLRQCLSEIENRRAAVRDSKFKLTENYVKLNMIRHRIDILEQAQKKLQGDPAIENSFNIQLNKIEMERLISSIHDTMIYMEGALKDIASFQSSYLQIIKNKNLPENWDEQDLEEAEVEHHLQMGFLLLFRDILVHGRIGMGTIEYLQQFGVHPMVASELVAEYITKKGKLLESYKENQDSTLLDYSDIDDLFTFLKGMSNHFKNEYKKVLKEIGLDKLTEDWYMYKEKEFKKNS